MSTLALEASAALSNRAIDTPKKAGNLEAVKKSAKEFEAVFLNEMLSPMFEGISTDGPFGGGEGEDTYRSLMIEQYANNISAQGGIGLASSIQSAILAMQGTSS
jgi:Rod binding domain-containing protein